MPAPTPDNQYKITTTGTLSPVVFDDLGARSFVHPTVDYDLLQEFTEQEIYESADVQDAIGSGHITVEDKYGNPITDPPAQMNKETYDSNDDGIPDSAATVDDGVGNASTAAEVKDAVDRVHDQVHDIDGSDHNGVSGATEDNLVSFDANGRPKDSGYDVGDFDPAGEAANEVGAHETTYDHSTYDTAYTHSQTTTGNPHNLDPADVGAEPADSTIMKEGENVSLLNNDADYQSGSEVDSSISTHAGDANAHHNELHSIASHNDTSATGAELDTLTDGSNADSLHDHTEASVTVTHASTTGQTANDHHNQSHVLATETALGPDHTISGATAGDVLRASGATAANFQALNHADLANKDAETDIKHVTDDEKDALDNAPNSLTEANPVVDYSFIAGAMKGFIHNLLMSMNDSNPDYQVDIGAGRCVSDDGTDFIVSDSDITVDITASGVNGLDTGSESSSTWYAVWIIKNPTNGNVRGLLSESFTSPTLPSGYTKKRRIGSIYNDSGSDFFPGRYEGSGSRRYWIWDDDILVLSGGSSTSYTDVDASDSAPPSSRLLYVRLNMDGTSFAQFTFRENGNTAAIPDREYAYVDIGGHIFIPVDENQIFEYYVTSGDDAEVRVQGYWEDL